MGQQCKSYASARPLHLNANGPRCCLTRACSRQAGRAPGPARAALSRSALWNVGWCGHGPERLQLMRISLGGRTTIDAGAVLSGFHPGDHLSIRRLTVAAGVFMMAWALPATASGQPYSRTPPTLRFVPFFGPSISISRIRTGARCPRMFYRPSSRSVGVRPKISRPSPRTEPAAAGRRTRRHQGRALQLPRPWSLRPPFGSTGIGPRSPFRGAAEPQWGRMNSACSTLRTVGGLSTLTSLKRHPLSRKFQDPWRCAA